MTSHQATLPGTPGRWATLNGTHHRAALNAFLVIVLAHWAEHLVQAYQIWGLGWSRPEARGVLGMPFPGSSARSGCTTATPS